MTHTSVCSPKKVASLSRQEEVTEAGERRSRRRLEPPEAGGLSSLMAAGSHRANPDLLPQHLFGFGSNLLPLTKDFYELISANKLQKWIALIPVLKKTVWR